MKSITLKKLFMLHSWVGIVTAILLFIVAFTGALAVLSRPELKIWANPALQQEQQVTPAVVTELVNEYFKKVPPEFGENIHIYLPTGHNQPTLTILFESHDGDENHDHEAAYAYEFNPVTLELTNEYYGGAMEFYAQRKTDAASYIAEFHADLHLGRPLGLILTGFLGLTLLVSTVTGLYIHRQFLRELFTFRRNKELDVIVNDGHKIMGIWGSLFHGIIGFTGAFLGLATVILLPAAAFVSFGGDQDQLVKTFTAINEPVITNQHVPTRLDTILVDAQERFPKAHVLDATVMAHNDKNAEVYLRLLGGESVASKLLLYKGDGSYVKSMSSFGDIPGVSIQVLELFFPLHFGNFGGLFVKIVWTILGLTTALLPLSGMMMWLSKRARGSNPTLSELAYQRWNRLIIGSCGGLVLACALLFPAQILLNALVPLTQHNHYIGPLFFYSWLTWLLVGLVPQHYYRYLKQTLSLLALCCVMVLPLNVIFSRAHVFSGTSTLVAVVDLCFMALGLLTLYSMTKLSAAPIEHETPEQQEQPA